MTKVKFETAALRDAFKKANIVAPSRGEAFDQSGGIVLEVDPASGMVIFKATNTEIFHMEWVTALEIEGEATSWRMASQVVAPIVATLPIGTGKYTIFEEKTNGLSSHIEVRSGKTRAKFLLMDMTFYPTWATFDPSSLTMVKDIGGRIQMVEWAAGLKEAAPLSGVNFFNGMVRATDRYRLAVAPLVIDGMPESGITVPAGILGQLLQRTGEVMIGFTENEMLLMPDDTTQLRVVTYAGEYPAMQRLMDRDRPEKVVFKKAELLEIINRAILAAPGDRMILLQLFLGRETMAVKVDGSESGLIDQIDVAGYAVHERVMIRLTPKMFADVLANAPNESVTLHYDSSQPERVLYVDGGSGYEVWVVARRANE